MIAYADRRPDKAFTQIR
ncbi:hypothetical protein ACFME5_003294 [Escherichia coli]